MNSPVFTTTTGPLPHIHWHWDRTTCPLNPDLRASTTSSSISRSAAMPPTLAQSAPQQTSKTVPPPPLCLAACFWEHCVSCVGVVRDNDRGSIAGEGLAEIRGEGCGDGIGDSFARRLASNRSPISSYSATATLVIADFFGARDQPKTFVDLNTMLSTHEAGVPIHHGIPWDRIGRRERGAFVSKPPPLTGYTRTGQVHLEALHQQPITGTHQSTQKVFNRGKIL